jgi:hypothetical protein
MSIIDFLQVSLIMDLMLELDYDPRVDVFLECSPEQHAALSEQGHDTSTRWFVVSRSTDAPASEPRTEVRVVSEPERDLIVDVARGIQEETDASGEAFSSFRARMEHVANELPQLVPVQGGPRPRPRIATTLPGPK